ncbi:hypothetical protein [uncultured Flavobacterium sp.]|uniref:hypothetical protein n=1 Tax=uncultured Flavobacterium sp. TaxID=165435 RepID=UPI003081A701
MALNIIQITKINGPDFLFEDKTDIEFPVAPLASVNSYNNNGQQTLKICATLYINSKNSKKPDVIKTKEKGKKLKIYFDYDWDEETPETYDVWYVEVDYTSETVGDIKTVISYLRDIGPVEGNEEPTLSRGTRTSSGG